LEDKMADRRILGVHHVTYLVRDFDEVAAYLERNFGLKKEEGRITEYVPGEAAILVYQVGDAVVDFLAPLKEGTQLAKMLEDNGPGLLHVGYAVENIEEWIAELTAKGNVLTSAMGVDPPLPLPSPVGYKACNIATSSPGSGGLFFHLSEGKAWQYPFRWGKSPEEQ
jgi:catechol 2,3-dioxygenase-like lactoylglutathione lyase family enzyme